MMSAIERLQLVVEKIDSWLTASNKLEKNKYELELEDFVVWWKEKGKHIYKQKSFTVDPFEEYPFKHENDF